MLASLELSDTYVELALSQYLSDFTPNGDICDDARRSEYWRFGFGLYFFSL